MPEELSLAGAQAWLDGFCARVGDNRLRHRDGQATTVGALAALEPLAPLPPAFPATLTVERVVSAQALVAFAGNSYSVPPGLAGASVRVSHRLGAAVRDIATTTGVVLARHRRQPDGAGVLVHEAGHVAALETAVLAAFDTGRPCPRKLRRPPSPAALAHAEQLRAQPGAGAEPDRGEVVVDLAVWAQAARGRQVAP